MPFYDYWANGYLAGFAAFTAHLSFFPGAAVGAFRDELKDYDTAAGVGLNFIPALDDLRTLDLYFFAGPPAGINPDRDPASGNGRASPR
jgi:hypothetical protein